MKFTSISGQLNSGIHHSVASTIAIKNSAKTIGLIALAGLVAVTATFGPVSADGPESPSRSTIVNERMNVGLWELHSAPTYDAPHRQTSKLAPNVLLYGYDESTIAPNFRAEAANVFGLNGPWPRVAASSTSNVLLYGYDESTIAPNFRAEAANVFGLNGPWPGVAASTTVELANQDFDLWAMHHAPTYDAPPSPTSKLASNVLLYGYDESTIAPNFRAEAANVFGLNGPWPRVASFEQSFRVHADLDRDIFGRDSSHADQTTHTRLLGGPETASRTG